MSSKLQMLARDPTASTKKLTVQGESAIKNSIAFGLAVSQAGGADSGAALLMLS